MIKSNNIKPLSYRQLRAIDIWLNTGRKNKARALREASYGKSVVRQPHKVFNSPAVKRELVLRGYGERGVGHTEIYKKPISITKKSIDIDFTKISLECLMDLRVKLDKIPDVF